MKQKHLGVVLVIALVLLAAMSLLAASSLRGAISTESISGAVRTSEMALQAAEIALRHCESFASLATAPTDPPTDLRPPAPGTPQAWQDLENWDIRSAKAIVLALSKLNGSGSSGPYRRPSECMIEPLPILAGEASQASPAALGSIAGTGTPVLSVTAFVITARGFGPDVAAGRGRPVGSEVWLQSQIERATTAKEAPHPPVRAWRQLFMR